MGVVERQRLVDRRRFQGQGGRSSDSARQDSERRFDSLFTAAAMLRCDIPGALRRIGAGGGA
eukprot:490890-Pyramimonas_sp.AAC.1